MQFVFKRLPDINHEQNQVKIGAKQRMASGVIHKRLRGVKNGVGESVSHFYRYIRYLATARLFTSVKVFILTSFRMKSYLTISLYAFAIAAILNCKTAAPTNDSVALTNRINQENTELSQTEKDIAEFLTEIADGRMMDKKEGEEALKKGTTPEIRQYGQLMVKDQTALLKAIKKLAKARQINLPMAISAQKQEGLENLRKEEGKEFDQKFIKMMIIDHERDIKLFKKASGYEDMAIKRFIAKYYSKIQLHLDKAETLKKKS